MNEQALNLFLISAMKTYFYSSNYSFGVFRAILSKTVVQFPYFTMAVEFARVLTFAQILSSHHTKTNKKRRIFFLKNTVGEFSAT